LISGVYQYPVFELVNCECAELQDRNTVLEIALANEQELRRKYESSSHIYSYELGKAMARLAAAEAKLKQVRNSFQFLRAGFTGFSTDLNNAIDSIGSNVD
jgi:tRNA1(Val) A37 N6-methylase TrmN6